MKPVSHNLDLYKGTDFKIQFRLLSEGTPVNLDGYTVRFIASSGISPAEIDYSSADSPANIIIEDDLVTLNISKEESAVITPLNLYFQLITVDTSGFTKLWWQGRININKGLA